MGEAPAFGIHSPIFQVRFQLIHTCKKVNANASVFLFYWSTLMGQRVNIGKIADGKNGDVAVDQYHRYKVENLVTRRSGCTVSLYIIFCDRWWDFDYFRDDMQEDSVIIHYFLWPLMGFTLFVRWYAGRCSAAEIYGNGPVSLFYFLVAHISQ